jgi:WD40 repeat protein
VAAEAYDAETSRLGSDAGFVVERDRQSALLMAVETYRRDPGFEGLNALQRVLVDAGPFLGNIGAGNHYRDARWVTDDRLLAVTDGEVHLLDVSSGAVIVLPIDVGPTASGADSTDILATSPAGFALVAAAGGRALLVDATDGTVEPFAPADDAQALAISDDGSVVAAGRADGTLEILDRGSGDVTATALVNPPRGRGDVPLVAGETLDPTVVDRLEGVDHLQFDRSGNRIVSSGGVFLRAWNTSDLSPAGPEIVHMWGEDEFNLVATTAENFWLDEIDDDIIVVAGESFVVRWRMSTAERLSLDMVAADLVGAASAGGDSILLLSEDGRVVERLLSDLPDAGDSLTIGADFFFDTQEQQVSQLTVDDDRSRLAVATDDGVVIASLDGTRLLARAVPIGASDRPSLTRDGETLAAGLATDGLYDLTSQPPTHRSFEVDVEIAQFAGSPAAFEFTATGPSDVVLWTSTFMEMRNAYELDTGDYLGDFWGAYVPAWSDDGRRVARLQRSGGTKVDEPDGEWRGYENSRPMISADFDSTGDRVVLVFADGSPALVVDLESGTERPLPDMPGGVVSAAFTPDDDRIVAVAGAGAAWVFNARTLNRDRELEDGGVVAGFVVPPPVLDAGGTLLFSAADGVARLWHVESGRQIGKPLPAQAGGRPWGVADSETLRVVTPHDGNALIWNLEVDEWVELACSAAGRNMTETEWAEFGPRDTELRATCPGL